MLCFVDCYVVYCACFLLVVGVFCLLWLVVFGVLVLLVVVCFVLLCDLCSRFGCLCLLLILGF